MRALALFLASFFSGVTRWLFGFINSKVNYAIAAFVVSGTCMAALVVVFKSLIGLLIIPAVYSPWYAQFVMAFFACWPSNAETCIAACWSADIAVFLYRYRVRLFALVYS